MTRAPRRTPGELRSERPLLTLLSSRLRARRVERRLSLDRLAALSDVSKGMLVQIENGEANPSIATLCKVASALGASVADLVQVSEQQPAEVMPAAAPRLLWRGPKGGTATMLVGSAGPAKLERGAGGAGARRRDDRPAAPPGAPGPDHPTPRAR